MSLISVVLFLSFFAPIVFGHITAAPSCPIQADSWHQRPELLRKKRDVTTWCDASSSDFFCLTGSCYTGGNGYVGCCTAASCVPRTICIDYTSGLSRSCDYSTGGCVYCSNPQLPYCTRQFKADQYIVGCGAIPLTSTLSDTVSSTSTSSASSAASISTPFSSSSSPSSTATPSATPTSVSQPPQTSSGTVTATDPSSATNQGQNTSAATTASAHTGSSSTSRGLIIGVVIGAAGGTVILLVLLFLLWKYLAHRRMAAARAPKEKSRRSGYSLGSRDDDSSHQDHGHTDGVVGDANAEGPAELEDQSRRSNESGNGSGETNGGAISQNRQPHYHCVNPDSTDDQVAGAERSPSWSTSPVPGVAEVPADVPTWHSPSTSTMTSPVPSNSSLWMVRSSGATPRRQSGYVAYTPSVYTSGGQPPSSLRRAEEGVPRAAQAVPAAELEANEVGQAR